MLSFRYKGTQRQVSEYGYVQQQDDRFQVLVPRTIHQGSIDLALALVRADARLRGAFVSGVDLQVTDMLADGTLKIEGTRTRQPVGRLQNNFEFSYRAGLTSEETAVDAWGAPLAVTYNGVTQPATVQKDVPVYDVSATGIRDLPMAPATLQEMWMGAVNAGPFYGARGYADPFSVIGAGALICAEVSLEPHYISLSDRAYRIRFRWIGSSDGWRKTIYWKDPATGLPPDDPVVTNWAYIAQIHREVNYHSLWPFGVEIAP